MKVRLGLLLLWLCCGVCVRAQYAPQVGIAGSTALPATSPLFTQWARGCTLERGYKFLDSLSMGYVSTGDSSLALGMADRNVVSLGDSGIAVLTFPGYIYDGAGADFAVFENGFANPTNDSQAFLELAFVEVSSDSTNFYRFPAHSNTPLTTQIPGAGVYMYADKIHNLAGKYIAQFGTPFDLADLSSIPTLDVNHIVKVRLIDVVGDIRQHICRDSGGTTINDPYPTPFAGGGFDLDALGIIHSTSPMTTGLTGFSTLPFSLYPNPATDYLYLQCHTGTADKATLTDVLGHNLWESENLPVNCAIPLAGLPRGVYFVHVIKDAQVWVERVVTY